MTALLGRLPRGMLVAAVVVAAAALNLAIGLGAAHGQRPLLLAAVIGLVPVILLGFGALVEGHRATLAWAALGLNFVGLPLLSEPLPLPGGTNIFATDVIVLLTIGAWIASRLSRDEPSRRQLSPIFGWPLVLFGVTVMSGVLIGHERYGASIIAQPFRMVLYAAIVLALTEVTVPAAWRAITRVFYAGAAAQALYAAYYLATGTSQSTSNALSTGGLRVLALSVAIYLTGSLVCALLNLERETRPGRQFVHIAAGGMALFGIIVSFGRTTYAAVALIIPLLFVTRRYMRRTVLLLLPLLAPALVLVVLLLPSVAPEVIPTLQARLVGTTSNDLNVRWREKARAAALEGVDDELLTGVGFGRVTRFEIEGKIVKIEGDPHNSFIFLLAGGGLLSLGSFLGLCALYVADAIRRLRRAAELGRILIVWALMTWLAFMVNAAAGPIFPDPTMMMTIWILFSIPSIVALNRDEEQAT